MPLAQKHRRAVKRVNGFLEAERAIWEALPQKGEGRRQEGDGEARSSDSWRGARRGGRRFHSLRMEPLTPAGESARKAARTVHGAGGGGILGRIRGDGGALLLFAVEIAALVGFLLILSNYYVRLRTLDGETTAATPQSAVVAAATETQTVVPSATPSPKDMNTPTRAEMAHQKEEPSPSPSREPSPEPTREEATPLPGKALPERLVIPSIDVDAPIVQGDAEEDLEKGVGHRPGSANPGAQGNMVLSAHNDIHGEIFRDLQTLKEGADVYVHTDTRLFHYLVQSIEIVPPTKVEVMDPTDDARLTMITCHPYLLDTHRVVAVAHLEE
ncbi:MAG: sortase [Anaerolineae bacterium]